MTINYVAVLVCGVASMIVGFLWYGPLFGKAYMQVMGVDTMTEEMKAMMKKKMWIMYFIQLILSLITAGVLDWHILNWANATTSTIAIAVCTWFGFIMPTVASGALWSGKTPKMAWKLFFISAGAQLVTFIIFGIILGAM